VNENQEEDGDQGKQRETMVLATNHDDLKNPWRWPSVTAEIGSYRLDGMPGDGAR
jgi:hypothetical protein